MNRLNLLFISAMLTLWMTASAKDKFTINGCIPGIADSVCVQLRDIEGEKPKVLSTVFTTDGRFSFTDSVDMPSLYDVALTLRSNDGNFYRPKITTRVMVEGGQIDIAFARPADIITRKYIPESMVEVKGSDSHLQLLELIRECGQAEEDYRRAHDLYVDKWYETHNNKDSMPKYENLDKMAKAKFMEDTKSFIKRHPDYHISSILTTKELTKNFVYDESELEEMYSAVSSCPDTARQSSVKKAYELGKKYARMMKCPDFEVNDTTGNGKSMSEYLNPDKYTILDFWASWCGPCRAAIPHMKRIHSQYGDKIDFYSISVDNSVDKWRTAMQEESMEWTQLHLNEEQKKEAINLFYMDSIPRVILLSPQGQIICSTYETEIIDEHLKSIFQ